ncbi:MAG: recombinase family protein [Clostridiaceae bacterium]|nr:recombinase family protein [Clostridiaceae bacterium]
MSQKEKRQLSKEERKNRIRERYKGVDPELLETLPPDAEFVDDVPSIQRESLRVAVYVRVSTDDENQTSSYELQINSYRDMVEAHEGWELVGIYADEGISGTSLQHRIQFNRLIADCEAGKIDLIITKSISRFARNTVDSLLMQRKLANMKPPVAVYFETENLNSMDSGNDIIMTVLSATAQEESHVKSEIMVSSLKHRFEKGIFLTPELLGYDRDEDGNLVINEDEADTVRLIFYLFLGGFSTTDIAEILTDLGRETKIGNTVWSPASILAILQNERHCGDVISWKTYTYDYLEHKSRKNRGKRPRKKQADHHEGIVTHEEWNAAQRMIEAHKYGSRGCPLPVLEVVDAGALRGFVPVNRSWTGFSEEDYANASRSVYNESDEAEQFIPEANTSHFDLSGYQIVRAQFFSTKLDPAMTISDDKIRFNTACLRKFEDVEYVEMLLNTVENCIAIRPCRKDNPNAIRWGTLREDGRWAVLSKSCRGFAQPLYSLMGWNASCGYRMRGQFLERDGEKIMLFDLNEPEITVREEVETDTDEEDILNFNDAAAALNTAADTDAMADTGSQTEVEDATDDLAADSSDEGKPAKRPRRTPAKIITLYPLSWIESFGDEADKIHLLERVKYSGDWDVLRPAKTVENVQDFTREKVDALMDKAQELIDKMREAV